MACHVESSRGGMTMSVLEICDSRGDQTTLLRVSTDDHRCPFGDLGLDPPCPKFVDMGDTPLLSYRLVLL